MTDVQVFTVDDTWVRPDGVKHVRVVAVGGGGGGGGGDVGGAGVNGGGGGKGGHYVCAEFSAADLQETVGVQVGSGGAGGGSTADGTNGEDSIFGVALTSEVLGVVSSVQDSDSTSFVVSLPDGATTQGDLLIVCVSKDGTGAITWPSGWSDPTLSEGAVGGGASAYMGARWRYIDGTEGFTGTGDTITVTGASEKWQADAWLITGANTGQDPVMNAITGTGTAANPTSASSPQINFDRFLFIVQATWNDDPGAVTGYPYADNQHQAVTTGPGNTRHARCSKFSRFRYDDPAAFTVPNGDWRALTISMQLATQGELLRAGGGEAGAGTTGLGGDNAWASTVGWTTAIDGGNGGKGGGDFGGGYVAAIGGTGTVFSGAGGGGGGGRDGGGTGQAGANGGASPDYGVVGSVTTPTIPVTTGAAGDSTRGGDGGHGGAGATTTGANGANGGVVGGGGGGGGGAGTTGGTGGTGGDGRVWVYSW